jgi:hypothetical protein
MLRAFGISLVLLTVPSGLFAQSGASHEFLVRVKEAYRTAKSAKETASVTMWCKAMIKSSSFKEYNEAMTAAIRLMEADKIEEANGYLKRAADLD